MARAINTPPWCLKQAFATSRDRLQMAAQMHNVQWKEKGLSAPELLKV